MYYEVKILHLMEKTCKISKDMLYNLDSSMSGYKNEKIKVSDAITFTEDYEMGRAGQDVLYLRENVMTKLRNTLYLRTKLN